MIAMKKSVILSSFPRKMRCTVCGRLLNQELINVEGIIHHKENVRCLDLKSCRRAQRKKNKQGKKAKR